HKSAQDESYHLLCPLSPICPSRVLRDTTDIFMQLGYLSQSDYEHWRFRRIPCLERVMTLNLGQINFIMKTVRRNSLHGKLLPRVTVYQSWGQGKKSLLRFSKTGRPHIEETDAAHFVTPQASI